MNYIVRHGDILCKKIDQLPEGLKKRKGNVILWGEVTTHAHRLLNGDIFEDGAKLYLVAKKGAYLSHEEHKKIMLPVGNYAIFRTREYDYSSKKIREVRD